jgi:hypothetical protein
MPAFCTVESQVVCPRCGEQSHPRIVYFHWGQVPFEYRVGDAVEWLRDAAGNVIPPLQRVSCKTSLGGVSEFWNCGERHYQNVLAFDNDTQRGPIHCGKCGEHLAVAAHIENGVVVGTKTLLAADAHAEHAIINDDGSYTYLADKK